jgi:hypothetical protein
MDRLRHLLCRVHKARHGFCHHSPSFNEEVPPSLAKTHGGLLLYRMSLPCLSAKQGNDQKLAYKQQDRPADPCCWLPHVCSLQVHDVPAILLAGDMCKVTQFGTSALYSHLQKLRWNLQTSKTQVTGIPVDKPVPSLPLSNAH